MKILLIWHTWKHLHSCQKYLHFYWSLMQFWLVCMSADSPPPSYDSIFGEVQRAKSESNGVLEFLKKVLVIFLSTCKSIITSSSTGKFMFKLMICQWLSKHKQVCHAWFTPRMGNYNPDFYFYFHHEINEFEQVLRRFLRNSLISPSPISCHVNISHKYEYCTTIKSLINVQSCFLLMTNCLLFVVMFQWAALFVWDWYWLSLYLWLSWVSWT